MFLVVWKYAQMHQNTFLTTSYIKKYLFKELDSGCLEVCANASKHVYNQFVSFQTLKNIFFKNLILVVWKYVQMRQNMYITTSDVK